MCAVGGNMGPVGVASGLILVARPRLSQQGVKIYLHFMLKFSGSEKKCINFLLQVFYTYIDTVPFKF